MIRRDEPADGAPSHWALISQVEHARLAGRLAEPWVDGPFAPLWPRDELLWAIEHHDDGWRQWEACPGVDSRTGRPRNFTEMPAAEALAIWRHSVDAAAAAFPLAGYVVAGHFCALARRAAHWREDPASRQATAAFIADYEQRMAGWLAAWQSADSRANTPQRAATAVEYLQFFDALSLWLCCAPATVPHALAAPGGGRLILTPLGAERIAVAPWPFALPRLAAEVAARRVRVARYATAAALTTAPSEAVRLGWTLEPAPAAP
jgi:Protein of unknown function (DUF3891)